MKSGENYLKMIVSMIDKKFISQIGDKMSNFCQKKFYFKKFKSVKWTKAAGGFELMICVSQTPTPLIPLSYDNIQANWLIQTI